MDTVCIDDKQGIDLGKYICAPDFVRQCTATPNGE